LNKIGSFFTRIKELSILAGANIGTTIIGAFFWIFLASLINTEEYGQISYLIATLSVASTVSFLGAGNTLIVYTSKGEKIQPPIFIICITLGIISSIILFFVFRDIGISLYLIGYIIFSLVTSEYLGLKLFKKYSAYVILQRILLMIFSISLFYLIGIDGIILGMSLSFFVLLPGIYHTFKGKKIDFKILRLKRGFMINNYILDLSFIFNNNIDKLIIGPLFGFATLGNYHLGMQFFNVLLVLPGIMYQFMLPHESSGNSSKLLKKGLLILSVIFSLIGIFLAPSVLTYLFPKFSETAEIVQIMSLAIIPASLNVIFISKLLGNEKSKPVLLASGIFIVVMVLGIIVLGQSVGINGIAMTVVLAYTIQSIYFIILDRIYKN
jgi:O-antigen/teichoic acid export membrane protein